MQIPIACSLTAGDARDRVAEWRAGVAADVDRVEEGEGTVRLRLRAGDDVLLRIVDLAEREQECCPFFGFRVELRDGRRWLEISAPDDARPILADLMSKATDTLGF